MPENDMDADFLELVKIHKSYRATLVNYIKMDYSPAAYVRITELAGESLKLSSKLERAAMNYRKEAMAATERIADLELELQRRNNELKAAMKITNQNSDESIQENDQSASPPSGEARSEAARKRGAPIGHRGNSRSIPEQVDSEEVVPPPETCTCGCSNIIMEETFDEKYIEDIVPVTKFVTRVKYQRGRCAACGKVVRNPKATAGPPTGIGPHFSTLLTFLRQSGLTYGQLEKICKGLNFPISRSGLLGIVNRTTDTMEWVYDIIGLQLRSEKVLNIDETSWKVNGIPWYIWVFCNDRLAYFHAIKSRASKVLEDVLGHDFDGIGICDFYAAYNVLKKTQRCLGHLLKDIKKERMVLRGSEILIKFDGMIKEFIRRGLDINQMSNGQEKQQAADKLRKYLDKIIALKPERGRMQTLLKRIKKYKEDIFRFVENAQVDYHNNRAERQLRPNVISRKMSFGSNTEEGAKRICILNSVIETCKLQKLDPIEFIKTIIMNPEFQIKLILQLQA